MSIRARGKRPDRGESLVETIITIVIVSVAVTALVSALGTAANASNAQREDVQMDAVMRNYAEATRLATRSCTAGGSWSVAYAPPSGYSVAATPASTACPALTATQLVTLIVEGPNELTAEMQVRVRTP